MRSDRTVSAVCQRGSRAVSGRLCTSSRAVEVVGCSAEAVGCSADARRQADLQGVWDFRTITPMERPKELANKATLTAEEARQSGNRK